MRIGILTLPLHTNYGGILQAYALQTVLERMGHEVVVLDTPNVHRLSLWKKPIAYPVRLVKKYILGKNIKVFSERYHNAVYPVISQYTQLFIDKYIHRREVANLAELKKDGLDAIVVGSDQIWRPLYYPNIENAYLGFARNWKIRRIAYATSFGTDEWEYTSRQTEKCGDLLRLFDAVSVREASGVDLCRGHFGVMAEHVLDPTMLLGPDDYIRLFETANTPRSAGTLLVYVLDETPEKADQIDRIAHEKGLVPFRVNSKVESMNALLNERIQPPVEQWLRGFYDADFVITDSFHACVFSILFKKPFKVLENKNRGNTRICSLLEKLDVKESENMAENTETYNILAKWRSVSNAYLQKFIGYVE